jgi:outer membrane protein TolC
MEMSLPPALGGMMSSVSGLGSLSYYDTYSVGLSANWDILGGIGLWKRWQQASATSRAAKAQFDQARSDLKLNVRLAYFQTQLAATQVRLYAEALRLAQSQAHDLDLRLKAGTSSRIDWLTASNDELARRASYRMAQASLAGALRDLFALTGGHEDVDVAIPEAAVLGAVRPANVDAPTVAVRLDDIDSLYGALADAEKRPFKAEDVDRLRVLAAQVESARRAAQAAWAGHLPGGSLGLDWEREHIDLEDLPVTASMSEVGASAKLNVPIFSFGQVQYGYDAADSQAKASAQRAADAEVLSRAQWQKGHDRLAALRVQRELQTRSVEQADKLHDMVYQSYKIGGSTFLEVQSTTLQALQAGLDLAETETQMLIELANLSALTGGER